MQRLIVAALIGTLALGACAGDEEAQLGTSEEAGPVTDLPDEGTGLEGQDIPVAVDPPVDARAIVEEEEVEEAGGAAPGH